ncbi:hypothetical protein PR048_010765 [Dryococelus australis]|uniref:Uncharacterized protein n=1 Tax=Dryococelus australis TaxID=614101 RepID=A0ABQ9I4T5_9NEOP|nr:hypothetical protein PR048_010765 [Dryococelus australis]
MIGGAGDIPEISRRPAASSGTIPTCENQGVARPGIERGSPAWETITPPLHHRGPYGMEWARNEGTGEMGDLREDPPTSGIVQHDSPLRRSGDPDGD